MAAGTNLRLTVTLFDRNGILGGQGITDFTQKIIAAEKQSSIKAAAKATQVSQAKFKRLRAVAPPRPGRNQGSVRNALKWSAGRFGGLSAGSTGVFFDTKAADRAARHWIIHEIGTGKRATLRSGGVANRVGRPSAGAGGGGAGAASRRVRSQRGRLIPGGLVWAQGGQYVRPQSGGRGRQQLFPASQVRGVPLGGRQYVRAPQSGAGLVIGREIQGQHMVRDGARAGFRQYETSVLEAARRAFDGRRKS